eukprot:COSAG04_NODE_4095_length_2306_cov_1.449026_2_plen_188_part_00
MRTAHTRAMMAKSVSTTTQALRQRKAGTTCGFSTPTKVGRACSTRLTVTGNGSTSRTSKSGSARPRASESRLSRLVSLQTARRARKTTRMTWMIRSARRNKIRPAASIQNQMTMTSRRRAGSLAAARQSRPSARPAASAGLARASAAKSARKGTSSKDSRHHPARRSMCGCSGRTGVAPQPRKALQF